MTRADHPVLLDERAKAEAAQQLADFLRDLLSTVLSESNKLIAKRHRAYERCSYRGTEKAGRTWPFPHLRSTNSLKKAEEVLTIVAAPGSFEAIVRLELKYAMGNHSIDTFPLNFCYRLAPQLEQKFRSAKFEEEWAMMRVKAAEEVLGI